MPSLGILAISTVWIIEMRKLVSGCHDVESGTLDLGFAGREDNEDVGVGGEAGKDKIESRGFDEEFVELMIEG